MSGVNKVMIVGRLGKKPDLRYTPTGTAVSQFSVATSETWGKGDQRKEKTEWHKCVAWGKAAEFAANYLDKGGLIYAEGSLRTREWDKDGERRYTTEIHCQVVQGLTKANKPEGQMELQEKQKQTKQDGFDEDAWLDDEVPF
jgi:single-strand DNA-binding protein